jgi:hypothetical protein
LASISESTSTTLECRPSTSATSTVASPMASTSGNYTSILPDFRFSQPHPRITHIDSPPIHQGSQLNTPELFNKIEQDLVDYAKQISEEDPLIVSQVVPYNNDEEDLPGEKSKRSLPRRVKNMHKIVNYSVISPTITKKNTKAKARKTNKKNLLKVSADKALSLPAPKTCKPIVHEANIHPLMDPTTTTKKVVARARKAAKLLTKVYADKALSLPASKTSESTKFHIITMPTNANSTPSMSDPKTQDYQQPKPKQQDAKAPAANAQSLPHFIWDASIKDTLMRANIHMRQDIKNLTDKIETIFQMLKDLQESLEKKD